MLTPRKILAIKFRSMGDTVVMTPALTELRRALPNTRIHVAVTRSWAPLLENHPAVDQIWAYERHEDTASRAKAIARMALKLRKERYDWVVNFHASPSSSVLAFAVGAHTRSIHFHGLKDKNRYSNVEIPGKGQVKPIIERDMDAVRAFGIKIPESPEHPRLPKLYLTHEELDEANATYDRAGLDGAVLGLGLGASRPTKIWPIERFAELAVRWCLETQGSVFTVGAFGEEHLATQFLKEVADRVARAEKNPEQRRTLQNKIQVITNQSVRQLAAMLYHAAVFVGNDSGPVHVSAALQTPTVTMLGPEHPHEWHPYPPKQHPFLFIEDLACRRDAPPGFPPWCGLQVCTVEAHQCMQRISVDSVFEQTLRVARR